MTKEDKKIPQTIDPLANPTKEGSKNFINPYTIGLGAIVIGVVVALYVIGPIIANWNMKTAADSSQPALIQVTNESNIYTIENLVVNPAQTKGTRFLSVSFGFELGSNQLLDNFQKREAVIRDALITILSSKTIEQLSDAREKEIARHQIKKRISTLLDTEQLAGVYYTDFVLQ